MSNPMTAPEVLNREFFEIRAKILEIAASFDRLDRGDDDVQDDPRVALIHAAIKIMQSGESDRAERIQLLFSREYSENWREEFSLTPRFTSK